MEEFVECASIVYMLISYHPKVYDKFHIRVPGQGSTPCFRPGAPPLGSHWVPPQGPSSTLSRPVSLNFKMKPQNKTFSYVKSKTNSNFAVKVAERSNRSFFGYLIKDL